MIKQRVISGFFIVAFLAVISLADELWFSIILFALGCLGLVEIISANKHRKILNDWIGDIILILLPVEYLFLTFVVISMLRWQDNGWWLFLAIIATSAYDTMAFFIGKTFGMHKIAPKISPKKTWEGTIAGFFGSIPVAVIIGYYFLSLVLWQAIFLGVVVGILAFFGDLLVSWYKRQLCIKDMGHLIPGHGGLLDRIDSHLLVMWGMFFFLKFV